MSGANAAIAGVAAAVAALAIVGGILVTKDKADGKPLPFLASSAPTWCMCKIFEC